MEDKKGLKLFISYSHEDEKSIKNFLKHIAPLKNNGLIDEWYDRKIIPGSDFQDTIDNNLENTDVICLFVSANFLSSYACIKEKKKDFVSLVTSFTARLYGPRRSKRKTEELIKALENENRKVE